MKTRNHNREWPLLDEYHGSTLDELKEDHGEIPEFNGLCAVGFDWKVRATWKDGSWQWMWNDDALDWYENAPIRDLNKIAANKDTRFFQYNTWIKYYDHMRLSGVAYNNEFLSIKSLIIESDTNQMGIVINQYHDQTYYKTELRRHKAFEIKYLNTNTMESNQLVYLSNDSKMVSLNDIVTLRNGKAKDTERELQSYAYGLHNNMQKKKYKKEKTKLQKQISDSSNWIVTQLANKIQASLQKDDKGIKSHRKFVKVPNGIMDDVMESVDDETTLKQKDTKRLIVIAGDTDEWAKILTNEALRRHVRVNRKNVTISAAAIEWRYMKKTKNLIYCWEVV